MTAAATTPVPSALAPVSELLLELRAGRPVILVDDEHRENEGDLLMPAATATPQWINFMAREGRGLICVTLTPGRAKALDLTLVCPPRTGRDEVETQARSQP